MPQKVNATIVSVEEAIRPYDGPNGTLHFIQGMFADGSAWSTGCKPEYSEQRKQTIKGLVNQAGEYEVDPKPDYQGRKQWKLLSWPGKPAAGGYGGGGGGGGGGSRSGWQPRFKDTPEGLREEREAIFRNVALQQAIHFHEKDGVEVSGHQILHTADQFVGWLVGSPSNRTFGDNSITGQMPHNGGPTQGRSAAPAGQKEIPF